MPRVLIAFAVVVWIGLASLAGAQSLPAGWALTDIGRPPAPGSTNATGSTFTISSRGWDVSGPTDQFTFLSKPLYGDATLIARVTSLQNTNPWSLAGLMIRQSLSVDSRQVSLFVTPSNGVVIRSRASTPGDTVQMTVGPGKSPVWLKVQRRSSTVTASRSMDGVTWTSMTLVKVPLNSGIVVGLVVASHSATASVAATFSNITLNGIPVTAPSISGGNTLPSVSLTSPSSGSAFAAPATIAMGAAAADPDGSVVRVDFYAGSARLGSDTTSPYTFSWGGVPVGSYTLKAVAVDNAGAAKESSPVTVAVNANRPPLVSLTSPLNGTTFSAPAAIPLTAIASDADGSIQRVDFYNGSTLIGSSTTRPYLFNWLNVPAGAYSLGAVARDNSGGTSVSPWSNISVASTSPLSKAIFRPAIVPSGIQHYMFDVFAAGADPQVAVPVARQNLGLPPVVGEEITVDVRNTIASLLPGNYIATVSAVTLGEGTLRSAPFAFRK